MEDDADGFTASQTRVSLAAAYGLLFMVVASAASGSLALAAAAIGGSLFGYAICTTFCGKDDACPPSPCWPEGEATAAPDEPQRAVTLHAHAPKSVRPWLERVEPAADAQAVKRSR